MNKTSIITLSAALLLGLSACSTSGEATGQPSTPPSQASQPALAQPAPAAEAPAPSGTTGTSKFGQVWKYEDGVTITVSKPVGSVATDTSTAAGQPISVYTVTIVNGAAAPLKPTAFATVNYGAEGLSADQVFDSAAGIGASFDNTILPGKRATVKIAFAHPATAKDVVFSIAPDFGHSDAIFVNS